MEVDKLLNFTVRIDELTKTPDKYLSLQDAQAEKIKHLTADIYNFTKKIEPKSQILETLPRLVVKNLDEEQIWQQIELQNNSVCNKLVGDISQLLAKNDLTFLLKTDKPIKKIRYDDSIDTEISVIKDREIPDEEPISHSKIKTKKVKPSVVDDKFFKLHEMEEFLEKFEKEKEEDDEDINYFEELSDYEEQLHYNDFFDQPDNELVKKNESHKTVKFVANEEEDNEEWEKDIEDEEYKEGGEDEEYEEDGEDEETGSEENDEDSAVGKENESEDEDNTAKQPSAFEARQERIKLRIKALESAALKEKPWPLKGEVTADSRPQNSLLEEYVEFDIATRPAPILTEKSTLKLEDVILQRIKDKAWDDVVRKIKPTECDLEYKKKLVLDQEKSKLSLAQIYEQEYLNQLDKKNESVVDKPEIEAPEHKTIRIMMNELFVKLDALSNFYFTPRQVKEEVKIITNIPAINMEEVAPITASDAALLAPEEIAPKSKGELIGKSERTATDKKRERRQKKIKQQLKFKKIAAKEEEKLRKDSTKGYNKNISQKLLQKITKNSNVVQLDQNEKGKYVKSSTAFFSKLQEEKKSLVKRGVDLKKPEFGKKVKTKKFKK